MMNKTYLIGRLTKDPELKHTANGIASLRFTLAVNRTLTSAKGEKTADFINCIAWRTQAENMAKFLKKGSQVLVEGQNQWAPPQQQPQAFNDPNLPFQCQKRTFWQIRRFGIEKRITLHRTKLVG